jgi:serine acetyltransferase
MISQNVTIGQRKSGIATVVENVQITANAVLIWINALVGYNSMVATGSIFNKDFLLIDCLLIIIKFIK